MSAMTDREIVLELYKAGLEDLGRIGARHETLRTFYLSVVSALFVLLSAAGPTGALLHMLPAVQLLVGGVGVLISVSWFRHMGSFGALFKAKLDALEMAEKLLPFQPVATERWLLGGGTPAELEEAKKLPPEAAAAKPPATERRPLGRYVPLTQTDRLVAVVFMVLFAALAFLKATG
jgi:hypothetical protein